MNWIKRMLLLNENRVRRKQVLKQIAKCEKSIHETLDNGYMTQWNLEKVEALKLRIIELQSDLIELDYKDINEKIYELD